ncbi:uncharacterized protein LOC117677380 [Pantherophis guttatus]|uniref:Uncharacterized protein LOC117677380 n=1 Tax=Pantherophis guttatus TaxID=94885 RepID=A0ABM3ZKK6_PANGU|nr:uncharacterized protein LOC117677380 [Pantherophis guttatus]
MEAGKGSGDTTARGGVCPPKAPFASFTGPRNNRARRLNVGDGDTFSPVFSAGGPVGKNRLRRSGHTWRGRGRLSLPPTRLRRTEWKTASLPFSPPLPSRQKKKDATLEDPLPGAFPHLSPLRRPSPVQPSPALPPAVARGLQCRKQKEAFAGTYLLPPGESDRPGSSFSHGRLPRPCSSASLSSSNRRILELCRPEMRWDFWFDGQETQRGDEGSWVSTEKSIPAQLQWRPSYFSSSTCI